MDVPVVSDESNPKSHASYRRSSARLRSRASGRLLSVSTTHEKVTKASGPSHVMDEGGPSNPSKAKCTPLKRSTGKQKAQVSPSKVDSSAAVNDVVRMTRSRATMQKRIELVMTSCEEEPPRDKSDPVGTEHSIDEEIWEAVVGPFNRNRVRGFGYRSAMLPSDLPTKPPTGPTASTATTAESAKVFTAEEVAQIVTKEVLAMQDKMFGYFSEQDRRQREVINNMQDRQAASDARIMFLLQSLLQSNVVPQQPSVVAASPSGDACNSRGRMDTPKRGKTDRSKRSRTSRDMAK